MPARVTVWFYTLMRGMTNAERPEPLREGPDPVEVGATNSRPLQRALQTCTITKETATPTTLPPEEASLPQMTNLPQAASSSGLLPA